LQNFNLQNGALLKNGASFSFFAAAQSIAALFADAA
jgi:hypothetical protein